jgi:hypothetical protein
MNIYIYIGIIVWPKSWFLIRVIRKVRQKQHQNPEFRHTRGEIQKIPAEKYISIQGKGGAGGGVWQGETQKSMNFGGKLKFHPLFPLS